MAISDCIRCDAKAPGEHNNWEGFPDWLDVTEGDDDLMVVCPDCITPDERRDIEREQAQEMWAMLREALSNRPGHDAEGM
jgi:hypothetical protein